MNILFIDDEQGVREFVARCLELDGHQVEVAANGEEGIKRFGGTKHDLVITDMRMQGMSGIEVAAEVKAIDRAIPVIMLTGYAADMINPDQSNIDIVIPKPVTRDDFRSAIAKVCPG